MLASFKTCVLALARDKALLDYVQRLATNVIDRARADAAYAGVLKALPAGAGSCR